MIHALDRLEHVEELLPEICTLDCGTLNFGDSSVITVNTPNDLRKAAKRLQEINVKPEIEAFDLGNMWFGTQLVKEGLIKEPPLFQICLGIPWGAPATPSAGTIILYVESGVLKYKNSAGVVKTISLTGHDFNAD